jgi:hypothetical protein
MLFRAIPDKEAAMKKRGKTIVLGILGLLALVLLSFVLYFYIALSGNPIHQWQERREIIKFFESRYDEDFSVVRADYDYKRSEFEFTLISKAHPDLEFRTTLNETTRVDKYAERRSEDFLYATIGKALGSDYDHLTYHVNVYEDLFSTGLLEPDLNKRLSQNEYTIDFSWDAAAIDEGMWTRFLKKSRKKLPTG